MTTKKGYDGCRKAEYLYAHDPITDKTFANLGETTISNLKASFDGVETGGRRVGSLWFLSFCKPVHCQADCSVGQQIWWQVT